MGESNSDWGPLIDTKFFVPRLSHPLFVRSRLLPLLDGSLQRKLTLVSAPAGYGKTTLMATWLQSYPKAYPQARPQGDLRVAWLSLEPGDNDPRRFWTYVLTALDRSSPGIATEALSALRAGEAPPFEATLSSLINALAAQAAPIVLVLDDYQAIGDPQVHASLVFLLEHLPPQLHLILLTRTDPPLQLARLRARDQLLEIRTRQLRCTAEESAAFLAQVMKLSLPDDVLQAVIARTEGWLVGLQLTGLSLRRHADPAALLTGLGSSRHLIVDYLTDEVLRQQPPSTQEFLRHTSILDRMCASLCEAVVGQPVTQEMLEELAAANLFVVPLDEERRWYRYHSLFAEALHYRLEQDERHLLPTLHQRASQWYRQQGNVAEAAEHAALAQAWSQAGHAESDVVAKRYRSPQPLVDPLTHREMEVLLWLAQGASNQDIAQELVISLDTAKRHVSNILSKLDAKNRTQAVARARSLGLLEEE
jgi:LuxR family maltose regulon positive regulatory protein